MALPKATLDDKIVPLHLVIGGGASGLVLSKCLANAGERVMIFEQGSDGYDQKIVNPIQWTNAAAEEGECSHSLAYVNRMQRNFYSRQICYHQGVGIGGSTSINAMIWTGCAII